MGRRQQSPEPIDFEIVHDAALRADSEEHCIRTAAAPLDDSFLASFLTASARRFAEKRVLLGKPSNTPSGDIGFLKIFPVAPSFFPD